MADMRSIGEKALRGVLWLAILFEIVTLGGAGLAKFGSETWREMFVGFGYPAWGALVIGSLELVGALGLLIPRVRTKCALLLMAIMLGALFTVAINETPLGVAQPLIHLAALGVVLWITRLRTANVPADEQAVA